MDVVVVSVGGEEMDGKSYLSLGRASPSSLFRASEWRHNLAAEMAFRSVGRADRVCRGWREGVSKLGEGEERTECLEEGHNT